MASASARNDVRCAAIVPVPHETRGAHEASREEELAKSEARVTELQRQLATLQSPLVPALEQTGGETGFLTAFANSAPLRTELSENPKLAGMLKNILKWVALPAGKKCGMRHEEQ